MFHRPLGRILALRLGIATLSVLVFSSAVRAQQLQPAPFVHQVRQPTERLEMIANTSRLLTLDKKIPRAVVNNPEILDLVPLSPSEIQISAKKPGVTQINLWDENNQVHAIDVIVYGDAQELAMLLKTEFPDANIRVRPLANSLLLVGQVDDPGQINHIVDVAKDYYPKVIANISVGGAQQIMLHVKVMEVSRTKLRELGFDFAGLVDSSEFLVSSVGGVIAATQAVSGAAGFGEDTVRFGIVDGNTRFFGFIKALRRLDCMKILAEPTLVTVSGRPAQFKAGGEVPYPAMASPLSGVSIDWKDTGVTVDFVPIVLGNGNIRLEVRPVVREIDETRSFPVAPGVDAPAFTLRQVDTGVEMKAGQTLALAGLISKRMESETPGIPWLADLPYFGAPFRRVKHRENEIELLIMVTPELVEAMDCEEVPPCGPGCGTESPSDCELYWKGWIEVPSNGPCGPNGCNYGPGEGTLDGGQMLFNGQMPPQEGEMIRVPNADPQTAPLPEAPPSSAAVRGRPAQARPNPASPPAAYATKRQNPPRPQSPPSNPATTAPDEPPGLIGPVGYDVIK